MYSHTRHMGSRKYTSELHTGSSSTVMLLSQRGTRACSPPQKTSVAGLSSQEVTAVFALCCKSFASQVLLKGSKEFETVGPHKANRTCEWFRRYDWEIMDHPSYSLDLAHSDSHLFGPIPTWLASGLYQLLTRRKL
jgi:hypothetical protein